MSDKPGVILTGEPLTIEQVVSVARQGTKVEIAASARQAIEASRAGLETARASGRAIYGVNTGFGSLAKRVVPDDALRQLQRNLVVSHAAGVGTPLDGEVVRAMMLILAASLCRGRSGVRLLVVEQIVAMLNQGVTPTVPEIGSVGASGDLAPLAHIACVMIGQGSVASVQGQVTPGAEALAKAGLKPIELEAKEGLALINGTHLMCARMTLCVHDFDALFSAALCACAMSIDSTRSSHSFLDPRVYEARNQPGTARVADHLRTLLGGGQIVDSHKEDDSRVQDPYSFRCAPIVLGAVHDSMQGVRSALACELGAVTDNPLVMTSEHGAEVVSAGNFHGMSVALPLDSMALCTAHVAGIAERRVFFMLAGQELETKLPPFLSAEPGVESGLMIVQYAAAACCNELVGLAAPASVANISTCAGMEDYNSWGPRAAAKAQRAVSLARSVVAIELLCGAQALEFHRPLISGQGVERAYDAVRRVVAPLEGDRSPSADIASIEKLISEGSFFDIANE